MKTSRYVYLYILFLCCLFGSRAIYCHVLDLEFVSPADRFMMDREEGYRGDFWDWLSEQDAKADRRDQWINDKMHDLGMEIAECFDPEFDAKCPQGGS